MRLSPLSEIYIKVLYKIFLKNERNDIVKLYLSKR